MFTYGASYNSKLNLIQCIISYPAILLAVGLNDDNPNDFLSSLLSISNDDTYPETTNGNTSSELFRFSSDEQRDNRAIIDDRQMIPNPTLDQNLDIINMPMSQQIIENSNALMYQMNPFIFEIIDSVMFVKQQPKANNRIRYECDGSRFLPDSRYHPMSINLPNLQHILSAKNQTLGIIMTIVTSTDNPNNQTFVHANDIIYREADMIKIAYGCIFIPLRQSDINNGEKEFRRLSILYKKYNDYTFDLTPFNTNTMFGTTEKYTILNDHNMEKVPKVKCFKKDYDLLSYKLVFQLALKEDNMIFISNITCETEIVHEQIMTQKSSKRTASCSTESLSEEESNFEMQISNSSKRFKSSTPPLIGLPFTSVHPIDHINELYKDLKDFVENLNSTELDNSIYTSESSIHLSNRVAITNSKQLQLAYPLENTYRARYKSDYFPQSGTVRRPRYIADNASNHFITLQLPTEYQYDIQNDYIRVALITTFIEGHGHYYSPYKFQKDHYDINVSDENPIYIQIENTGETQPIMRLQLVLIKSKLDQLNYVQPLILFNDRTAHIQNIIHEEKLTPKELINKYQLDKSQLAFTLCTKLPNGLFKPHPETTIISSMISEASAASKKAIESTAIPLVNTNHRVNCPCCAHSFDPDAGLELHGIYQRKSNHETSRSCSKV
ncbi:unnamed protein product [Rotaria sordida]|uniref:Uncharacterized protein n=1 Tax=Rotaria sordida TaxID=392033 RepID=A0A818XTK1_9BILA|nr:unnamed protein product [Rotaria sordida]